MQTLYTFSYNPTIATGTATTATNWRMAYQQPLLFYKGTSNVLRLVVYNNNQDVVDLTNYDVQVQIVDKETRQHFVTKTATVTTPTSGISTITFTSSDLENLNNRFYHLIARLVDPDDGSSLVDTEILYIDDNFGAFTPITLEDAWNFTASSISTTDGIPSISFTGIAETPNSFLGAAGQYLKVNDDEDALEYVDPPVIPNLLATGNVIPSANVTYSLGNVTNQWSELWVSNATIYMGGIPLSVNANGQLLLDGETISSGGGDIADFVFTTGAISGPGNISISPALTGIDTVSEGFSLEFRGGTGSPSSDPLTYLAGPGGPVRIFGGDATDIAPGGAVVIRGGESEKGAAGSLYLQGGETTDPDNGGTNGSVVIGVVDGLHEWEFRPDGVISSNAGLYIAPQARAADEQAEGYALDLRAGAGSASSDSMLYAGGHGGSATLAAGDAGGNGIGGSVSISGGNTVNGPGGGVHIYGGVASDTDNGGSHGSVLISTVDQTYNWEFTTTGGMVFPDYTVQNTAYVYDDGMQLPGHDNWEKVTPYVVCNPSANTVVYTAPLSSVVSCKLFVQVEGTETTGWETHACEILAVKSTDGLRTAISVTNHVHTSVSPLATFGVQLDVGNVLQVTARPAGGFQAVVVVRAFAIKSTD